MSIDTVSGGKVWSPPEPETPKSASNSNPYILSLKTKLLVSLGIIFTSCFVVTFSSALVFLGGGSEEELALTESIVNYTEKDSSFSLFEIITFVIFAAIMMFGAIIMMWAIDYLEDLSRNLKLVSVIAGIILGAGMVLWMNETIDDIPDQTAIVDEWMQETYGYELVEVLPVNKYSEKDGLLANGEEKFVVKDLVTGEEKTVYYYDREENFYLAETDSEFLEQFQNNRANVSSENK